MTSPLWGPVRVAEIKNSGDKWLEKLESLREYVKSYQLRFALLCVRVYKGSKDDAKAFEQLRKELREISRSMPNVKWILYRMDEYPLRKDSPCGLQVRSRGPTV
jgi:ribosomal protein L5